MEWFKRKWEFIAASEHSNAMVAIFSGLLFLATTIYTVFAALQWRTTERIMLFEERASMGESQAAEVPHLEVGKPIFVGLTIQNSGKTPARDVNGTYRIEILDNEAEPTFDYSPKSLNLRFQTNVWFSGMNRPIGITALHEIPGTKTVEPIPATQDLIDKFNARQIWFAVEGNITYRDIFGGRHWITSCRAVFQPPTDRFMAYQPSGTGKCTEYNDVDRN